MEVANLRNQSTNSNDPVEMTIEKALQTECKRHAGKKTEFLHLVPNVQTAKICNNCILQDNIPPENILEIRKVLTATNESQLHQYPILLESNLRNAIEANDDIIYTDKQQIYYFIQELTRQIQEKIEIIKSNVKQKIVKLEEINSQSKDCYLEIMNLQNLQTILLEDNNETKLVQFIREHISKAESNTKAIQTIYSQLRSITKEFSLQQPYKIKSLISSLLEEINFFNSTHTSSLKAFEESEENRNSIQTKQSELNDYLTQPKKDKQIIQNQKLLIRELQGYQKKLEEEINSLKKEKSSQTQENINKNQEITGLKQEITDLKQKIQCLDKEITEKEANISLSKKFDTKILSQPLNQQPNQENSYLNRILSKLCLRRTIIQVNLN